MRLWAPACLVRAFAAPLQPADLSQTSHPLAPAYAPNHEPYRPGTARFSNLLANWGDLSRVNRWRRARRPLL